MAFFDPNILWDVGFQLSFMATLGLVLYAGPLMDAFVRLAERFISNERARQFSKPVGFQAFGLLDHTFIPDHIHIFLGFQTLIDSLVR